jgi:hypothetical protein
MKRISIKNKNDIETHWLEIEDETALIQEWVQSNAFGLPERTVPKSADYDPADVLEEIDILMTPAIDEVLNESGEVVQEAIPAVTFKMVKLRAEYSIEISDISAEHALKECLSKRKAEYPSPEEFMNAYFDGGEAALVELQAKRLAVKVKYPKPQ